MSKAGKSAPFDAAALAARLGAGALFADVAPPVLTALLEKGRKRQLGRSETLYHRGDPGGELAIVAAGALKARNVTSAGREIVYGFFAAGAIIGEIAVLDGGARASDVVALEASEVVLLGQRDCLDVLTAHPNAMLGIIQLLCAKLRDASAGLEEGGLELTARAAAGLLRLSTLHGRQLSYGAQIDLAISQRDLGAYLGMSRENANRQLSFFRDEGYITIEENRVIILNADALAEIAETDPD